MTKSLLLSVMLWDIRHHWSPLNILHFLVFTEKGKGGGTVVSSSEEKSLIWVIWWCCWVGKSIGKARHLLEKHLCWLASPFLIITTASRSNTLSSPADAVCWTCLELDTESEPWKEWEDVPCGSKKWWEGGANTQWSVYTLKGLDASHLYHQEMS